jgi:hypothetical protein
MRKGGLSWIRMGIVGLEKLCARPLLLTRFFHTKTSNNMKNYAQKGYNDLSKANH